MQYTVMIKADSLDELSTIVDNLKGEQAQAPALTQQGAQIQADVQAQQPTQAQLRYEQAPPQPVPAQSPVQQAPIQQQPPVTQQPPQAVPTTAPTYSLEDLQRAASQLMADMQKQQALRDLLPLFGIQQLNHLPQEQYGAFATKLRELGAQL